MKLKIASVFLILTFVITACYGQQVITSDTIVRQHEVMPTGQDDGELTLSQRINNGFVPIVRFMSKVLFFDPFSATGLYDPVIYDDQGKAVTDIEGQPRKSPIPLIVMWLIV
ncbi:MAG: hypothetical protein Q8M23_09715, partial [Bacteroidales bacterium]|nr:hypothetical protein [Bacteroidales bacterium]